MRYLLTLLLCVFIPLLSPAQTGSVLLQDASGNLINSYSSIQGAYNAIPSPMAQPYVIALKNTYLSRSPWETFPIRLTEKAGASAVNTVTIRQEDTNNVFIRINVHTTTDTSDILVFDGADWITFNGHRADPEFPWGIFFKASTPSATIRAAHPVIRFVNGATHNTIRYFEATNGRRGMNLNNEFHILFDTTNTMEGNSYNTIEHGYFDNENSIRSKGSPLHPNLHNVIRDNFFERTYSTVLTVEEGTAAMEFNRNELMIDRSGKNALTLVKLNYLEDTVRIINNTIRLFSSNQSDSAMTAIRVSPVSAGAPGHECVIANNYITTGGYYDTRFHNVSGPSRIDSDTRSLKCFDFSTVFPVNALLAHNTVRLMPTTAPGTTKQLYSSVVSKTGNNAAGNIRVLNNVLYNERQGGVNGSSHPAIDVNDFSGMELNDNSYGSAGTLARIGNASYASFSLYHAAFPLQDNQSNEGIVIFEAAENPFLSALMTGNPAITGAALPEVPRDINGYPRLRPYRGADELANTCDTAPYIQTVSKATDSACAGKKILVRYSDNIWLAVPLPAGGYIHQWQSRTFSSPIFADIPGEHGAELIATQSQYTFYRVKDSCIAGGQVVYSNTVAIPMKTASIVFDSITVVPVNPTIYEFTVHHAGPATNYTWTFSDGGTAFSATKNVTHWFVTPGTYTATVVADAECSDPISRTMTTVPFSGVNPVSLTDGLYLFPNPANDQLMIKADKPIGKLAITDVMGRTIWKQDESSNATTIQTAGFSAGVYMIRIDRGIGNVKAFRFLVRH